MLFKKWGDQPVEAEYEKGKKEMSGRYLKMDTIHHGTPEQKTQENQSSTAYQHIDPIRNTSPLQKFFVPVKKEIHGSQHKKTEDKGR